MATHFQSIKAKSVAVLGSNYQKVFYNDKPTLVEDEDDIYIFRRKTDVIFECTSDGKPIANEVTGEDVPVPGQRTSTPLSRSTFRGYEDAKRKQLMAEHTMNDQAREDAKSEENKKKKDIGEELSEEDDLSVSDDDFDFEEDKEEKPKKKSKKTKPKTKAKSKKKETVKKKVSAKKNIAKKKTKKESNFGKSKSILTVYIR